MGSQYVVSLLFLIRKRSIRRILNNTPYSEITNTKSIPRKTLVFTIANISNALASLRAKIWVIAITTATNTAKNCHANTSVADVSIKNHRESPAVTVSALKRDDGGKANLSLLRLDI